ncbi:MAG: PIN domain-containing protein [Gemmataceae bacterium]|nr:PIN domain-containing protein [Gemmataceae bacterium]
MPNAPRRIVVDSGPIIALFDAGDAHHRRALDFVRRVRAPLLSTMAVVTEAMYVLDESLPAQRNLLSWMLAGGLTLVEPGAGDLERVIQLMEKYADLPMDFTDAVVVALCERLGTHHVASVDRDFAIYRYKGRGKFVNVFFE